MNTTTQTRQQPDVRKLACLDDWQLEDSDQDLRGHTLYSTNGRPIGKVDDMYADMEAERIAALRLEDGRLININAVDIRDGKPVLLMDDARIPAPASPVDRNAVTTDHIPLVEEHLEVGKRQVELGKVRIRTRVVSENVGEDVKLRNEHVDVERRPVDRKLSAADADALLKEDTVELKERGERVVVSKEAHVTGEVAVDKKVDTRTEHVNETVRHTEVDVDRTGAEKR